ncbi:hypothetical protein LOTGIDRAFT_231429 [Lottia gigantea]|uniref:CD109 antigen n=1 Tax=Lottia gigantea TaxID=225164 RepID=V4ATY4_LOTGI|nr:hypothetical protein LOTGIDRAFT_231429 [Lottia gigantea]ESO98375.1 hypothetical protein LOTGIDRAFT_231429 [Lottia gigantea]
MEVWLISLLTILAACITVTVQQIDEQQCMIDNVGGCPKSRPPVYMVIAPRKVRPNQVVQIFTSILRLEYSHINVRISVVKDNVEYAGTLMKFDRPSSRIMQLLMPQNSQEGQYRLRVEGTLNGGISGYIFYNETDILFDTKQASLFIQMSKPLYKQGQLVQFRVIPILPNMMPKYGSMTIYIDDPTGIPVRRWLGLQTNAGGLVSQSFQLSDQPNHGNWSIRVVAFGHTYRKKFVVEEFWTPRFDVNVTVPPYLNDTAMNISGVVLANQTSGRPVIGNASITMYFKPPNAPQYGDYPYLYRFYRYHRGRIDFMFTMEEIKELSGRRMIGSLVDSELLFHVNVSDWDSGENRTGKASTIIFDSKIKLRWIGDPIRTFKPDSVLKVAVAVTNFDGTPVKTKNQIVRLYSTVSNTGPATISYTNPILVQPVQGIAEFRIFANKDAESIVMEADYLGDELTYQDTLEQKIQLRASRYYSPSKSYITIETSTQHPKVNEYMIFHVKTSNFVPRIFYQVISGGNIVIGDELEMTSRQKTFAIALSREMIPTARLVVFYIRQPEEVVVDVLNFFVNGTRQNQVKLTINQGKDFSRDSIEFNAYADPGSYVAFAAMPHDLFIRGLNDGISENNLIDELGTYDQPANGSYRHLWRISDTEYEYKFFHANGYGIDANTTFKTAGLMVLTDARLDRYQNAEACAQQKLLPCFTGIGSCYNPDLKCNGEMDCADGADEWGCPYKDDRLVIENAMDRVSRVDRFYDDSSWAWNEIFVKPDGRVDFRVNVPKYPLAWVINGLSISREIGLGIMQTPIKYDAARYMYIQVETPSVIVRGEQAGVRVTVFNYWYVDDYIEVLVTVHDDPQYDFVVVEDMGIVKAYSPRTHSGDHQTILFLEPGQSKDIYMPIVPKIVKGQFELKVSASCFMERDFVRKTITVIPDGVENYYHTPYLIDLIRFGALIIPDFDVPVPERFVVPEQREHLYVPGSPIGHLSIFGDVVTPGFFEEYLNAENILHRPYGAGEMITFNFAYNMWTLKFMKASKQLTDATLKKGLYNMNFAMQRMLGYMHHSGYMFMFRDDPRPNIWLTAFSVKTFHTARYGEWERDLFIPLELINRMVVWLCNAQNKTTGAWDPDTDFLASDRKMTSYASIANEEMYMDQVPLTAYVLIALYTTEDVSGDALVCIDTAKSMAANYLSNEVENIDSREIFHLAITAYALSLTQEKSVAPFKRLWDLRRTDNEIYFADQKIQKNPTTIINTVRFLLPRQELMNEGYAVQSTAYALMAHIKHSTVKYERDGMMRWLQTMRNSIGGFASTQDTIVAMEALYEFTQNDPNRNVFDIMVQLESTATPDWKVKHFLKKDNYTNLQNTFLPTVWGAVKILTQGTGRALMQLTTTVNVEHKQFLKQPQREDPEDPDSPVIAFFDLIIDYVRYSGRNSSIMEMRPCVSWLYTQRSLTSGLSVLEIDIPTGYVVMNDTLREYVQSEIVPNLKRAEFYGRKVVFYFSHLSPEQTCVYFRANRWYPIANATIQHRMRVYDYYEPGMHNTTFYTTYGLFNLNICFVCGSYQCPYCPSFNIGTILKASFTLVCLVFGYIGQRYLLRS